MSRLLTLLLLATATVCLCLNFPQRGTSAHEKSVQLLFAEEYAARVASGSAAVSHESRTLAQPTLTLESAPATGDTPAASDKTADKANDKTSAKASDKARKAADKTVDAKATPAAKPQADSESKLARWFDLQSATLSLRYRTIENSRAVRTANQMQYQNAFKMRFKFDKKGNYTVNAGVFTGNNFTGSWNTTGVGTGDMVKDHFLKQLYFAAKPVKNVEVQFGGLYINRGESTEVTTYDNDGYITGQRLTVKRPKKLYFDEVSATYGYLGDTTQPNVLRRFQRLNESNYHQFLVAKKFGKRFSASADYTFQAGAETLRQAVKVDTKKLLKALDTLRFETYQRLDVKPDWGFNAQADKTLFKRLTVGGGYARIDPNYGGLNADRFNKGNRFYANGSYALSPEFSVSAFVTRGVGNDFAVNNRTRFDLHFSYNLLKGLQRTSIF